MPKAKPPKQNCFGGWFIACCGLPTAGRAIPYRLIRQSFSESTDETGNSHVSFSGTLSHKDTIFDVSGEGNGPIDAFFNAIKGQRMDRFSFVDYKEHAIRSGSDSMAVAYIHLRTHEGKDVFGVGISPNISLAPLRGILSAINRAKKLGI